MDIRLTAVLVLFSVDSMYYGSPTFTPFHFLLTNTSGGVSLFYGSNPWHFYFTNALPILCAASLPYVLEGLYTSSRNRAPVEAHMLRFIGWTIATYSMAGHKEWRFLHPLLPIFHLFAAKSYIDKPRYAPYRQLYKALTVASAIGSLYIVLMYCSGPIEVMRFLRGLPSEDLHDGAIGVLMPCHSIPGHAYLHRPELANGGMWALGCEPPLQYVSFLRLLPMINGVLKWNCV